MTPFQIQSFSPLWIPDLPTPSLTLYSFRLSTSLHMAFHLSNFDSSMEPPIPSSHRLWTCKSTFLPGVKNGFSNPTKAQEGRDWPRKDVMNRRRKKALCEGCRERKEARAVVSSREKMNNK